MANSVETDLNFYLKKYVGLGDLKVLADGILNGVDYLDV